MASRQQTSHMAHVQLMGKAAMGRQVAEPIVASEEYMQYLTKLIPSTPELVKAGFVVSPLTPTELQAKVKCKNCHKRCTKPDRPPRGRNSSYAGNMEGSSNGSFTNETASTASNSGPSQTCRLRSHGELLDEGKQAETTSAAPPSPSQFRPAVAIDCEMGVSSDFESELIRLSLIDYFSGQILIDRLVRPKVPMQHMNTRYSGVTRQDLQNAIRNRTCILGGLEEARKEVWKFVGPQTVVVGHSVRNDLSALRWIHKRCVDSLVVEEGVRRKIKAKEEEEEKVREKQKDERLLEISLHCGPGMAEETRRMMEEEEIKEKEKMKKMRGKRGEDGMSLKALTKKKLGRVIQDGGKKGHDSVEDAVAARDLIHHHILGLMQKDKEKKEAEREAEAAFAQVLAEGTRDAEIGSVFAAFP
ncbi:ribonuclease H-like domain-containing protein [Neurospora hispaniola]|uniref:Ribonuclease H-like domain-containing protein n=1 Tax=Neurospora hispaniola TaxID=588809 RepID=A0AAJ0MQX3_9PEZI|nr:ribonuclease H-like domain-containing protein [Neurospora hispaniola]